MEIQKISTDKVAPAVGPYSSAVVIGELVYTSGQIPVAVTGEIVGSDITTQADQVMVNLSEVLQAAGSCLDNTVKCMCFLADMADFAEFNKVYESYIKNKPARSCVAVRELPKGVLCEVEAIALKK